MQDDEELRKKYTRYTKAELIEALLDLESKGEELAPSYNSASRLAFFAEATTEGILIHKGGRIQDANHAALDLLAITRESLVGRQVHDFVVGGWHDRVTSSATQVRGRSAESIWSRENGTSFLCECHNHKLSEDIQVLHFRQVTNYRKATEERLRLAEEMWDLYNNTPCGYHTLDENATVVRMNSTELSWLGYDYTSMVGTMHFEKLLTPRSVDYFRKILPDLARRGWIQDLELDMLRQDGTTFPVLVSATAVFDSLGHMVQSRYTVFEISELKRANKDLRESEEKFRAIAEQSLIGIFIVQEGRIIYGNESMRRISGYDAQQLFDLGPDGFACLIHPTDRGLAQRTFSRMMLEGDKLSPRDMRGLHKNGETLWLQLSASHVILRGIPSIFGMVADVSERKRAEQEKAAVLTRVVRHQSAINQMATCEGLQSGDLVACLRIITSHSAKSLRVARSSVWLMDEKDNDLRCYMLYDHATGLHSQPSVTFGADVIPHYFQALSAHRAIMDADAHLNDTPMGRLHFDSEDNTIILDAAIRLSGEVVGALCLQHSGPKRTWKSDEVSFAGEAADQAAHAIMSHRRKGSEAALRKAEAEVRGLNTKLKARVEERTVQLTEVQSQLKDTAKRAGAADIATAVLHNVGNILTSVITSGQTIEKTVQTSSIRSMKKANKMLDGFLDQDNDKARQLGEFYHLLEDLLSKEHNEIHENVEQVIKKIDLIRDVITAQQSFASTDSQSELLHLNDVLEDALNIQEHTLGRYDVRVEKNYLDTPLVFVSRIRLVHVLINLIKNAREAMSLNKSENRLLSLFIGTENDFVVVKVRDNGQGVASENCEKIFSHGFSTKKGGHGFGLHSCAEAMEEMGGNIRVESDGPGTGATFVLSFPIPKDEQQQRT